jgi:hypothetical protein
MCSETHGILRKQLLQQNHNDEGCPRRLCHIIQFSYFKNSPCSQCTLSIDHSTTIGIDHFPVTICIRGQRATPQIQAKKRWNLKKINWDRFNILSEKEKGRKREWTQPLVNWGHVLGRKIFYKVQDMPQPKLNGRQLIKYDARGIWKTSPPTKKRKWREQKPWS